MCDGYPKPTPLRISTNTASCHLNTHINLQLISEHLPINKYITYIEYANYPTKGVNIKQRSKKAQAKKKIFYNQITIIVKPYDNRYNNIKIFNNGAVTMTGLINFDSEENLSEFSSHLKSNFKGCRFTLLDDLSHPTV